MCAKKFLSTPSARRATSAVSGAWTAVTDFYPRPPRGGRLLLDGIKVEALSISIHALREEGDTPRSSAAFSRLYFYPRPPRGGRLVDSNAAQEAEAFLSTPSARRATKAQIKAAEAAGISIHALREEGDCPALRRASSTRYFYPRPPRGGRPPLSTKMPKKPKISIHALREEGDATLTLRAQIEKIFLSTPSARRATRPTSGGAATSRNFYPRPPRGGRRPP